MAKARMTAEQRREALELEYERLKERADRIDALLQGRADAWISIKTILEDAKHIGAIEMDKPMAEARQIALAMATVFKSLAQIGDEKPKQEEPADPLKKMEDEVALRRARKQA